MVATLTKPLDRTSARPRWRGWLPLILLPLAVLLLVPVQWPRWVFMWLLAVAIYAGCKWLTSRRTPAADASLWRHAAYLLLWPGLDAGAFLRRNSRIAKPATSEWCFAAFKLTIGVSLVWGIVRLVPPRFELVQGWIGMAGCVFVLHFGLMHLLSCLWRSLGIDARPLMHWPIAATSLTDFWGRRWNTAFRDLTYHFVFVPLRNVVSPAWALAIGFLASGIVHDVVISLPARGGWGGPTLYFAIQGAAILVERSRAGRSLGLSRGWRGWLFAMLVLLAPAYWLFHPPFIRTVVLPFLEAIGAR
jgi:hypothetical protein